MILETNLEFILSIALAVIAGRKTKCNCPKRRKPKVSNQPIYRHNVPGVPKRGFR